jgi:hypothetical protein
MMYASSLLGGQHAVSPLYASQHVPLKVIRRDQPFVDWGLSLPVSPEDEVHDILTLQPDV